MVENLRTAGLVFFGAGIGGLLRWLIGLTLAGRLDNQFPWTTIFINLSGCFLIGILLGCSVRFEWSKEMRVFFGVGLLGGYTTFSSFGLESFGLISSGKYLLAITYVVASNLFGVALCALGYKLSILK